MEVVKSNEPAGIINTAAFGLVRLQATGSRPGTGVTGNLVDLNWSERHPKGEQCPNVIGGVEGDPRDKNERGPPGPGADGPGLFCFQPS